MLGRRVHLAVVANRDRDAAWQLGDERSMAQRHARPPPTWFQSLPLAEDAPKELRTSPPPNILS